MDFNSREKMMVARLDSIRRQESAYHLPTLLILSDNDIGLASPTSAWPVHFWTFFNLS